MKLTAIIATGFIVGVLGAAGPLYAHDEQSASAAPPAPAPGPNQNGEYSPAPYPPAPVDRASHLIGMKVMNPRCEKIGEVTDVVFDLQTERVSYIVVKRAHREHGTYAFAAIPPNAFMSSQDLKHLILNTDKIRLSGYQDFSGRQYYSSAPPPAYSSAPPPAYAVQPPQAGQLQEVIIAPAEPAHEAVPQTVDPTPSAPE